MTYVITDSCIKDSLCIEVCPTDCIHPKQDEPGFEASTQMYVDPEGCIDCGVCGVCGVCVCLLAPPTRSMPLRTNQRTRIHREERRGFQTIILGSTTGCRATGAHQQTYPISDYYCCRRQSTTCGWTSRWLHSKWTNASFIDRCQRMPLSSAL